MFRLLSLSDFGTFRGSVPVGSNFIVVRFLFYGNQADIIFTGLYPDTEQDNV